MQQELVAAINSIKGKAQADLEAVNELKRRAGAEEMAMPAIDSLPNVQYHRIQG
jgi:hypothetical protein